MSETENSNYVFEECIEQLKSVRFCSLDFYQKRTYLLGSSTVDPMIYIQNLPNRWILVQYVYSVRICDTHRRNQLQFTLKIERALYYLYIKFVQEMMISKHSE
jgi:hypothetical protein